MPIKYDIKDKTVLVTGANRGIGKIIVETFLQKGAKKIYAAVRNLDTALPLVEKYGEKIGIMGGIDMDKLSRLNEVELRKYIRDVLNTCMQGGRYTLGSGNSIANYVPIENFLIMLDEGHKFKI